MQGQDKAGADRWRQSLRGIAIAVSAACGAATVVGASGNAAPPPPRVIAIVGSPTRAILEPVDARTLAPPPGAWAVSVRAPGPATLSPSSKKIAVETDSPAPGAMLVVDAATGRIEHIIGVDGDTSGGLYWFDRNDARPRIVTVGYGCGSTGVDSCGPEMSDAGSGGSEDYGDAQTGPVLDEGIVLIFDPTSIDIYHDASSDIAIDLPKMPKSAPFAVVADVAHDRLFAISSAGLVAEVDHIAKGRTISYHPVDLDGQPFQATWAGAGKIALWGRDGLGTIDTRSWTTRAVATGVAHALATPLGLAAWSADPAVGLSVYRPDGSRRLNVLSGKPIRTVQALGSFLYIDAGRYSVNLRTGKVFGPFNRRIEVIAPSLLPIP